jgi:hypothetical protein
LLLRLLTASKKRADEDEEWVLTWRAVVAGSEPKEELRPAGVPGVDTKEAEVALERAS